MIGTVLGSYRITGELSAGGMGQVYKADHQVLPRHAAVKLLRPELTENTEIVQRFFNEAKAATAIRHPGIIEVFDFGYTDSGRAYLVMEFLEGEPLARRIDRGPLAEGDAVQIARGIASALVAAHGKGIVHRDLKPDNIFLVPDPDVPLRERPKVLDFGIAKLGDHMPKDLRHTVTGALIGTPLYMAPEQARAAAAIDGRADLYSLGCILYEMLVGKPPFQAEGAGELIAKHMFEEPVAPSARGIKVAPALEALTMRLLAKEPGDRYADADAVVGALDRVIGAPAARDARDAEPAETMIVTAQAPSRLPLIAGAVTAVLAGAAAVLLLRGAHHDAPAKPAVPPVQQVETAPPAHVDPAPVHENVEPTVQQLDVPKEPPKPVKKPKHLTTDNGSPIEDHL
ncbi:MAG: serine/threonine protein kinase [Deltaproteobacteria bacterium]|nr:serine/threonine protein kinase [Deltaproteobacteria bacterium]